MQERRDHATHPDKRIVIENIMCSPCIEKARINPKHVCYATQPFGTCSQCPNNSKKCDFGIKQREGAQRKITGAGKVLQKLQRQIVAELDEKGVQIAVDMVKASFSD
jgi:hypothetical protein